jgi:hypothetical protein
LIGDFSGYSLGTKLLDKTNVRIPKSHNIELSSPADRSRVHSIQQTELTLPDYVLGVYSNDLLCLLLKRPDYDPLVASLTALSQVPIESLHIEPIGVETLSDPLDELSILFPSSFLQ